MKLVKVTWNDIVAGKDWMSIKEALIWGSSKFSTPYFTTGYLIYESDDFILVASTYTIEDDGEESYNDISMIPTSVIRKIEQI